MKRLTKISARNFKGLTFDTQLAPATVLVGANFAGKTARTDAIRLLLLGHLPELGKNNKDSMGLASGREMAVEGTFDDGTAISRAFRMKGDSVSKEDILPPAIKDCEQLAVMLNADEYFALPDRARVEYVFANCPGEGMITVEQVLARVTAKVIGISPGPIIANGMNLQVFVERSIEHFMEKAKVARAYATKMEGTVQGLAALRAGDDQSKVAAGLTALDARRMEIHTEARALEEKRAALKADDEQRQRTARRRDSLEKELAAGSAGSKREQLAATKERISTINIPPEPDASEVANLRKQEMQLNSDLTTARNDYTTAAAARSAAADQLAGMDGIVACPYCGATGEGWKAIKRKEVEDMVSVSEKIMEAAKQKGNDIKRQATEMREIMEALEKQRQARQAAVQEDGRLRREAAEIETSLARLGALEEELRGLPARTDPVGGFADVVNSLGRLQSELNDIETQRRAAMGRQHELGRLAQAEDERDKAKAEAEAAKAAADELRVIQGEMVEAAFKPLLDRANRIFGSVLKSPLAYREGDIGTWRDGLFIGHRTMSGTEKTLVYASIQAALTSASPVRIMLIDELGRLDTDNKRKVGRAAIEAVGRGDIDQFIGIDAEQKKPGKEIADWARETGLTVVEL